MSRVASSVNSGGSNPLAMMIAGMSAAVGVFMLYKKNTEKRGLGDDLADSDTDSVIAMRAGGNVSEVSHQHQQGGSNVSSSSNRAGTISLSMENPMTGSSGGLEMMRGMTNPGIPAHVLSKSSIIGKGAGRDQMRWSDEQIGVSVDFLPATLDFVSELRRCPAVSVRFRLKAGTSGVAAQGATVTVTIEDGGDAQLRGGFSARDYQDACSEKLQECSQILDRDDVLYHGTSSPALYYCYEKDLPPHQLSGSSQGGVPNGSGTKEAQLFFARDIYLTSGRFGIIINYTSKQPIKSLPKDSLPHLRWAAPQSTPSRLMCAEPRSGLGFSVPIEYHLEKSQDSESSGSSYHGDHHGVDPSLSTIWAQLASQDKNQTIAARYERYSQSQYAPQDIAAKVMRQCGGTFAIKTMPIIYFDTTGTHHNNKVPHITFKPVSILTTETEGSSGSALGHGRTPGRGVRGGGLPFGPTQSTLRLEGLCGATAVKLEKSLSEVEVEDLDEASSLSSRSTRGRETGVNRRREKRSSNTVNATIIIYILAVRTEYVSFVFLNKDSKVSAERFGTLASTTINSLTFGNHHGQDTAVIYRNLRHVQPFAITLPSPQEAKLYEPMMGDPLILIQLGGLQQQVLYLRPFAGPLLPLDRQAAQAVLQRFERRMLGLLLMLPGKCHIEYSKPIEVRGVLGLEIVHSHELIVEGDRGGEEEDDNYPPLTGRTGQTSESLSPRPSEGDDDHSSASGQATNITTATTADVGREEFTLDNPLSHFDAQRILHLYTAGGASHQGGVEFADQPQEGDTMTKRVSIILIKNGVSYLFRASSNPYMLNQARSAVEEVVKNFEFLEVDD